MPMADLHLRLPRRDFAHTLPRMPTIVSCYARTRSGSLCVASCAEAQSSRAGLPTSRLGLRALASHRAGS